MEGGKRERERGREIWTMRYLLLSEGVVIYLKLPMEHMEHDSRGGNVAENGRSLAGWWNQNNGRALAVRSCSATALLAFPSPFKTGLRSHGRSTAESATPKINVFGLIWTNTMARVRGGDRAKARYHCGVAWRGML